MSLSSVVADVKHVLASLPNIRKEVVAGLAAAGTLVGVLEATTKASGANVAILATLAAGITGVSTFLANPKVVQILTDVASAVTPKSVKAVLWRKP